MTSNKPASGFQIGGGWSQWLSTLHRKSMPLRRYIAEKTAPDPATLGYPLFSARIRDRKHRWKTELQPNPYSAVSSKSDGSAYMRSLGHAVPEIYGLYSTLDDIPQFDKLPPSFVLKPTHGWRGKGVFLIQDGVDMLRKRSFTRDTMIQEIKSMNRDAMPGLAGPWVAEELLFHFDGLGNNAHDYKFYCFGPKVVAIQIVARRGQAKGTTLHWYRDPNWKRLPFQIRWKNHPERSALPKPPCLDEMLKIASDVGGRLNIFVRVDMYATHRGPVFGEFTAYPHSGNDFTPRADAWLGSHWTTQDGGVEVVDQTPSAP